jgi:hypothetical protein
MMHSLPVFRGSQAQPRMGGGGYKSRSPYTGRVFSASRISHVNTRLAQGSFANTSLAWTGSPMRSAPSTSATFNTRRAQLASPMGAVEQPMVFAGEKYFDPRVQYSRDDRRKGIGMRSADTWGTVRHDRRYGDERAADSATDLLPSSAEGQHFVVDMWRMSELGEKLGFHAGGAVSGANPSAQFVLSLGVHHTELHCLRAAVQFPHLSRRHGTAMGAHRVHASYIWERARDAMSATLYLRSEAHASESSVDVDGATLEFNARSATTGSVFTPWGAGTYHMTTVSPFETSSAAPSAEHMARMPVCM